MIEALAIDAPDKRPTKRQLRGQGRPTFTKDALETLAQCVRDVQGQIPESPWPQLQPESCGTANTMAPSSHGVKVAWRNDEVTKQHIGGQKFVTKVTKETTGRAKHAQHMTEAQWRQARLIEADHLRFQQELQVQAFLDNDEWLWPLQESDDEEYAQDYAEEHAQSVPFFNGKYVDASSLTVRWKPDRFYG